MTFPQWVGELGKIYRRQGSSIFVEVPLSKLMATMKSLKSRGINVVNAISGYDSGREIEVLYHFIHHGNVLTVKTRLKKSASAVPSVVGLFPNAMLFEQENHEALGIIFTGNKEMRPLLLGKSSPSTPLRKREVTYGRKAATS